MDDLGCNCDISVDNPLALALMLAVVDEEVTISVYIPVAREEEG